MTFISSLKRLISACLLGGALALGGASAASAQVSYEFIVYNNIAGFNIDLESANCTDGVSISAPSFISPGNYGHFTGGHPTANSTLCTVRYWLVVDDVTYGCAFALQVNTIIPGFAVAQATYSFGGSPTCYTLDEELVIGHSGGFFVMEP